MVHVAEEATSCIWVPQTNKNIRQAHLKNTISGELKNLIRYWGIDGKPDSIRADNGPEYVSWKLLDWARKHGIEIQYIQPGKPQQNAYIERYNRTIRHEWLDQNIIETIEEAQYQATKWLWTYNNERPNMGIGGITPAQKLKLAA